MDKLSLQTQLEDEISQLLLQLMDSGSINLNQAPSIARHILKMVPEYTHPDERITQAELNKLRNIISILKHG